VDFAGKWDTLFLILILRSSVSRAFYIFFASFSAVLAVFSRAISSRAVVRLISFLTFLFVISRASPRVQSPAAASYLPQYVFVGVLFFLAQLHVFAFE
jgi:hypothetical protein